MADLHRWLPNLNFEVPPVCCGLPLQRPPVYLGTGSLMSFFGFAGVFSYLSYRDPNLVKTLDNYDGTVNFLRDLEMDNDALTKAIIGTIGDVDSYQLPDAKGYSR